MPGDSQSYVQLNLFSDVTLREVKKQHKKQAPKLTLAEAKRLTKQLQQIRTSKDAGNYRRNHAPNTRVST